MTTVVNPSTTPVPVYNREGRTVETLVASGSSAADATPIPQHAQTTIVNVLQGSTGSAGVVFTAGLDVGSSVELYTDPNPTLGIKLFIPPGETASMQGSSVSSVNLVGVSVICRKISATDWRIFQA